MTVLSNSREGFSYVPDEKTAIIFDTDMDIDVDDVGALAVLYSYVQDGKAELLATVGSCNSGYAVRCLKGINAYFGHPDTPVGIASDCPSTGKSPYQGIIAEIYGGDITAEQAEPAVDVYRKALSKADDNSVVIVAVGALNNLCALLQSDGDGISLLTGSELIKKKAKLCVIMGGMFPESGPTGEYNIRLDPDSACFVAENCPVPVLWSGAEIGASIFTGSRRNELPESSPVRLSYNLYGKDGTGDYTRQSWDLTAVLYAMEGSGEYWNIQTGRVQINTAQSRLDADKGPAYNIWTVDPAGKDAILVEKMAPEKIAEILNERMIKAQKGAAGMNADVSIGTVVSALYQIYSTALEKQPDCIDMAPQSEYGNALAWGAQTGIACGYDVPSDKITREQLAAILCRYAARLGIATDMADIPASLLDKDSVMPYAKKGVAWVVNNGLMTSVDGNCFVPAGYVTQEELAAVLTRFCTTIFSANIT